VHIAPEPRISHCAHTLWQECSATGVHRLSLPSLPAADKGDIAVELSDAESDKVCTTVLCMGLCTFVQCLRIAGI